MWYGSVTVASPAPLQLGALKATSPKKATFIVLGVSASALVGLLGVIYGHGRAVAPPAWVSWLPALNALLNATSAVFLVLAYLAIRRRDVVTHSRRVLVSPQRVGALSRLVHRVPPVHWRLDVRGARPRATALLLHPDNARSVPSAVAWPLVFLSLFFSLSGRFPRHKSIARYTFPVWLYVSVTGVVVFALLRAYT